MTQDPPLDLGVVVPVHDGQDTLEQSIALRHEHLRAEGQATWRITIADNASTDSGSGAELMHRAEPIPQSERR